jgi:hypothetical protein
MSNPHNRPGGKNKQMAPKVAKPRLTAVSGAAKMYATKPDETTTWEQLKDTYEALAMGLVGFAHEVNNVSQHPTVAKYCQDTHELAILVNSLKRDISTFTTELVGIHDLHKDKTGDIRTEEDLIKSFNIYDNYTTYNQRFNAVLIPTFQKLTEIAMEAERVRTEAERNNANGDVRDLETVTESGDE